MSKRQHPSSTGPTLHGFDPALHMPEGYYSGDKPNPNLRAFVQKHSKPIDPEHDDYDVCAFSQAIDTSKATSLFNLHSYFSKKPHDAIRQYIRHYTSEGDLVLDVFAGSGGTIVSALIDNRKAIAIDRSPAATFITKNYCTPVCPSELRQAYQDLKRHVYKELAWLYETRCDRCGGAATTIYTVYSQTFKCPRCLNMVALYDCPSAEATTAKGKPKTICVCPFCYEHGHLEEISSRDKKYGSIPVEVCYKCECGCTPARANRQHNDPNPTKRSYFEKHDIGKIREIEAQTIPYWIPEGYDMTGFARYQRDALYYYGVKEVADLFTKRNRWALAAIKHHASGHLLFALSAVVLNSSRMYRHRTGGGGGPKGTDFMIPQIGREVPVWPQFENKVEELLRFDCGIQCKELCISTQNAYDLAAIPNDSIDYIFTDPPYGGTIQYGELSAPWEAWQGFDKNWHRDEITIAAARGKGESEWTDLIRRSMGECFRVLKPGRWLSLCYHDTSEGTWALVQDVMAEVGFIVDKTDSTLFIDTGQKTYNQLTADKATKRDLVINFRKPKVGDRLVSQVFIPADADAKTFTELGQEVVRGFLTAHPGATKDRVYDELVSRMVRKGQMEAHDFDALLGTVAETMDGRWYLKETADQIDHAEQEKEVTAADLLEQFMIGYLDDNPAEEGVHYSDLFERYLPVCDKPRRLLADWLPEHFFKTTSGTWRPPKDDEERQQKAALRERGTLRRVKRFANALIDGVPVREKDRPANDADLADWIQQCRRAGLYEQGRALYEKGGLNIDKLDEVEQLEVEDAYRICVKREGE